MVTTEEEQVPIERVIAVRKRLAEANSIISVQRTEFPDSLEFGEAKNRLKVYFDSGRLDEAKQRLKNALELRKYATTEVELS